MPTHTKSGGVIMPARHEIISIIGEKYLDSNIENDEFSYQKAFNDIGLNFDSIKISNGKKQYYKNIDLRFCDKDKQLVILIETKKNFDKDFNKACSQLAAYINYEKRLTKNDIIAILANTQDNRIKVYHNDVIQEKLLDNETNLKSFEEYFNLIFPAKKNDRETVIKNTYSLNELLNTYGIKADLRGQFVGTCLLAIKNNLKFEELPTKQILAGIRNILENLLDKNLNKAEKLYILDKKVLEEQCIKELKSKIFQSILTNIKTKIYPYINEQSTKGQDLLNLFFTTFNKYVGKKDKNQAFTPDHIVSFICKIVSINKNSKILDPCCGSGAFLVRALTDALDECKTENEKENVKKKNIYGIESEEKAFGLSTTNMLIHGDGNSNVYKASCFDKLQDIADWNIDRVLMNPPYNASKSDCPESYTKTWGESTTHDPSKGFYYVYEIANIVKKGKLAVLLPMQCAIGTSNEIKKYKKLMLQEHRLDAVFSLPVEMFHPGSTSAACCMIFELGVKHNNESNKKTFFGYFKDDGFIKRKNLGRIEKKDGLWKEKEKLWLELYFNRSEKKGFSILKNVTADDEWLAEAYMETDYSTLNNSDFEKTIRDFLAYQINTGAIR